MATKVKLKNEGADTSRISFKESIRSYNVIYPSGTEPVYYPMMEFEGINATKINELDLLRLGIERDKCSGEKHVTTYYFFSPPGLGKTVLGGFLARLYNCPYQIINCVSSMIDLDLLGNHILVGDHTIWQDGPIPAIIRATNEAKMGILIVNELNALTVNAQMALNPLLDRQEMVVLTQNNNENVKITSDSHLVIIASMNPDVLGINELQDSVRDRASAIIQMNYPSIEKEAILVEKLTGLTHEWAVKYCEVIAECRNAKNIDKSVSKAPSTRALIDWINYSIVWGPFLAFEVTIINRYCAGVDNDEIKILQRIAQGKAVNKWLIPSDFKPDQDKLKESLSFSEEIFQRQLCEILAKSKSRKMPEKERKKLKKQALVENLNLQKLDSFMAK